MTITDNPLASLRDVDGPTLQRLRAHSPRRRRRLSCSTSPIAASTHRSARCCSSPPNAA